MGASRVPATRCGEIAVPCSQRGAIDLQHAARDAVELQIERLVPVRRGRPFPSRRAPAATPRACAPRRNVISARCAAASVNRADRAWLPVREGRAASVRRCGPSRPPVGPFGVFGGAGLFWRRRCGRAPALGGCRPRLKAFLELSPFLRPVIEQFALFASWRAALEILISDARALRDASGWAAARKAGLSISSGPRSIRHRRPNPSRYRREPRRDGAAGILCDEKAIRRRLVRMGRVRRRCRHEQGHAQRMQIGCRPRGSPRCQRHAFAAAAAERRIADGDIREEDEGLVGLHHSRALCRWAFIQARIA